MEWYHICFACGRSSHPTVSIFSPVPDASWITFGPRPRDKHQIAHARSFNRRPRLLVVRTSRFGRDKPGSTPSAVIDRAAREEEVRGVLVWLSGMRNSSAFSARVWTSRRISEEIPYSDIG